MARGKHLSLEEARKEGKLDRFCKENPSVGNEEKFDCLLEAMAKGKPPKSSKEGEET